MVSGSSGAMAALHPATSASDRSPEKLDTAAEAADTNMPAATNQSRLVLFIFGRLGLDVVAVVVQALAPFTVQLPC
jgi:hypothetical protein